MFELPIKLAEIEQDDSGSDWESIKTFETLLKNKPRDRPALSALAIAYERTGDGVRSREYRLKLAAILAEDENWSGLLEITEHLLKVNPHDQEAAAFNDQALLNLEEEDKPGQDRGNNPPGSLENLDFDLNAEIDLAWLLLQNQAITQEQYEQAIDGLTESRMNQQSEATLSLLAELAAMDHINMDKILGFLAVYTNTPFVDLGLFEKNDKITDQTVTTAGRRLGVIPFAAMGEELMVAVLNPLDEKWRRKIRNSFSQKLHFYLTSPDSINEFLAHQRKRT